MYNLYLETYTKPDGYTIVPIETLISLFVLNYCENNAEIKVNLILTRQKSLSLGFQIKGCCSYECILENDAPRQVQSCILPMIVLKENTNETCIAGLCGILREIIKNAVNHIPSNEEIKNLLGFKQGCLRACAEVSRWTRFCEIDILNAVKSLKEKYKLNSPVDIPYNLACFEVHMTKPLRVHNFGKLAMNHSKTSQEQLEHCYAEGTTMNLSDLIIFPCVHIILHLVNSVYLRQYLPYVHKWYDLMVKNEKIEKCLNMIADIPTMVIDDMYVKYIIPEIPDKSLYKCDPRRYRPKDRIYTRQADLDKSLLLVPCEPEWQSKPFGWDIDFDWGTIPLEGQIPVAREERKKQQLENLAKAVLKVSKPGNVIVDFCAGTGNLGIMLAHCLPRCQVILLENKEESLMRAKEKVIKLNLTNIHFYQCNLDYFKGNFDIGVSLHACGVATDLVIQSCIEKNAIFVSCPCCYGSVQDNHILTYPRSETFKQTNMSLRDYLVIGHSADQTHDEKNCKTNQGFKCMAIIDTDRCLHAKESGYQVHMSKLVPITCTPKNNLIVGIPNNKI